MSKWPKKVKHRRTVLAKIYRPCQGRESYRVTWYAAGKRQMKSFPTYAGKGGAKEFAEGKVKELAANSQAAMLTPSQATDALAAFERLNTFHQDTGRKITLLAAVSEYCEAAVKAHARGITVIGGVEGFTRTLAAVARKNLPEAVEDFIIGEEPRTQSANGQRSQLSPKYHYNRAIQLRRFAEAFSGYAVCDIAKHDLDSFFNSKLVAKFSPKNRNHHRGALKQFLSWAVKKDYLPGNHRLLEADSLRPEKNDSGQTEFYTPMEFRELLEASEGPLRAMVAIGGLAGLRTQETLRLDWTDVWRIKGHIEITAGKSKTRQRRLVEVCRTLVAWLTPYKKFTTGKVWEGAERTFQEQLVDLCERAGVKRKTNGLRHSFCSYHFALHSNENLTAQQAGNSPAMIHAHYKGLATKKEAKAWFAAKPRKTTAKNVIPMPRSVEEDRKSVV